MRKVSSRAVNRLRHLDRTAYVPQTLSYRAVYPPGNPKVSIWAVNTSSFSQIGLHTYNEL